jgi:hypothetical protein
MPGISENRMSGEAIDAVIFRPNHTGQANFHIENPVSAQEAGDASAAPLCRGNFPARVRICIRMNFARKDFINVATGDWTR